MKKGSILQLNRGIHTVLKLFFLVLCSVLIATAFMILLYALPNYRTLAHAKASVELYNDEMQNNWSGSAGHTHLSNTTDSLMIMHAVYRPYDSVVNNAMRNPRPDYGESATENLVKYILQEEPQTITEYPTYWHGYLAYLIPALQLFSVGETKVIMMFFQFFLNMFLLYELSKRSHTYMILYAVVALFLNPVTTVLTFQDADVYCIMMISMILLLKYNDWFREKNRYLYFFALNGIAVAFVDYLTYPLVAYGIPLVTVLLINDFTFKESMKCMIINSLSWLWGYAGMWTGKWIMADLLTGSNTIREALNIILFRTSGEVTVSGLTDNSFLFPLHHVFSKSIDRPMQVLLLVAFLFLLLRIIIKKPCIRTVCKSLIASIPIVIVGVSPFVWYFVVRNHTIIHPHLAYRQLAVAIWAALVILERPVFFAVRPLK